MPFPQNLDNLALGEDLIRTKSKDAIMASNTLTLHTHMIERSLNILDYIVKNHVHRDEDQLIIQMLMIRLFNYGASAIKLMMAGYYQTSVMVMRDILETTFLLDYFYLNRKQIGIWRACDERERNKTFGAMKIRMALDKRDGFTERKRKSISVTLRIRIASNI